MLLLLRLRPVCAASLLTYHATLPWISEPLFRQSDSSKIFSRHDSSEKSVTKAVSWEITLSFVAKRIQPPYGTSRPKWSFTHPASDMPTKVWLRITSNSERRSTAAVSKTDIERTLHICSRRWSKFWFPSRIEFVSLSRCRNAFIWPNMRTVAGSVYRDQKQCHWVHIPNLNSQNSATQRLLIEMQSLGQS